jgi:hypothetical protein
MTNRGRPLPWKLRDEIRRLRIDEGLAVREVARLVGVNPDTVSKYAPTKFPTDRRQTF